MRNWHDGLSLWRCICFPALATALAGGVFWDSFRERFLRFFESLDEVAHALAEVHVELMLIHPFREGNGRLGRMLATLMALQAGLPVLDFSLLDGERREGYFAAVRAGMDRDYQPMKRLVADIIEISLSVL